VIFSPTDALGVKRYYGAIYCVTLCTLVIFCVLSVNVFTEVGAVIVIIAIYRGVLPLSRALGSASKLKDWRAAAQSGQSESLRQDIRAGVIGTFLGGFSGPLFIALEWIISMVIW